MAEDQNIQFVGSWVIFKLVMGGEHAVNLASMGDITFTTALPKTANGKPVKKQQPSCLLNASNNDAGFEIFGEVKTIVTAISDYIEEMAENVQENQ